MLGQIVGNTTPVRQDERVSDMELINERASPGSTTWERFEKEKKNRAPAGRPSGYLPYLLHDILRAALSKNSGV